MLRVAGIPCHLRWHTFALNICKAAITVCKVCLIAVCMCVRACVRACVFVRVCVCVCVCAVHIRFMAFTACLIMLQRNRMDHPNNYVWPLVSIHGDPSYLRDVEHELRHRDSRECCHGFLPAYERSNRSRSVRRCVCVCVCVCVCASMYVCMYVYV